MSGDKITVEGVCVKAHAGDLHTIEIEIGGVKRTVLAKRAGRLHCHRLKIIAGDRVTVEVSPYDTSRGRIVERERAA